MKLFEKGMFNFFIILGILASPPILILGIFAFSICTNFISFILLFEGLLESNHIAMISFLLLSIGSTTVHCLTSVSIKKRKRIIPLISLSIVIADLVYLIVLSIEDLSEGANLSLGLSAGIIDIVVIGLLIAYFWGIRLSKRTSGESVIVKE